MTTKTFRGQGRSRRLASVKQFVWLGCLAAGLALAPQSQAATLEFEITEELTGSGGTLSGPILVTFDDAAGPADVRLTIDLSQWDGSLTEYLAGLYFNYSGAEATGDWEAGFDVAYNDAASSNDGNEIDEVLEEFDGFRAGSLGYFDVQIIFNTSANNRLTAGETAVFDITAPGADISFFNIASSDGGMGHGDGEIVIARARSLGDDGEGSGWFTGPGCVSGDPNCDSDIGDVPEPSTMFLMGGSLLALAYFRKKRNS